MKTVATAVLALLGGSDALAIGSTSTQHAPARPAVADSYSWASAVVNRDVDKDPDPRSLPPLRNVELLDMQVCDAEHNLARAVLTRMRHQSNGTAPLTIFFLVHSAHTDARHGAV